MKNLTIDWRKIIIAFSIIGDPEAVFLHMDHFIFISSHEISMQSDSRLIHFFQIALQQL
jgi:hypothetical protein